MLLLLCWGAVLEEEADQALSTIEHLWALLTKPLPASSSTFHYLVTLSDVTKGNKTELRTTAVQTHSH